MSRKFWIIGVNSGRNCFGEVIRGKGYIDVEGIAKCKCESDLIETSHSAVQ